MKSEDEVIGSVERGPGLLKVMNLYLCLRGHCAV